MKRYGLTVVFQVCFVDVIWNFGFHDVQLQRECLILVKMSQ